MRLKIGDFARLGQVTVQTLRHYDNLGLLNIRQRLNLKHKIHEGAHVCLRHSAGKGKTRKDFKICVTPCNPRPKALKAWGESKTAFCNERRFNFLSNH